MNLKKKFLSNLCRRLGSEFWGIVAHVTHDEIAFLRLFDVNSGKCLQIFIVTGQTYLVDVWVDHLVVGCKFSLVTHRTIVSHIVGLISTQQT